MSRSPFQVLVLPFRYRGDGEVQFCILRRSGTEIWQGIAGGGEDGETAIEAARREAAEEASVAANTPFYRLSTQDCVPTYHFSARRFWPADLYVVPQFYFSCDITGQSVQLSHEHDAMAWCGYDEAEKRLFYDGNKTALWEISERIRCEDLVELP